METIVCKHGVETFPITEAWYDKHTQTLQGTMTFCPECNAETIAAIALRNQNAES